MTPPPHNVFHASPAQRVEFARQRYFEEGLTPSGIVSEAVLQSWARCQRSRHDPRDQVEFQKVSVSRAQLALQRNRPLLQAWSEEQAQLEAALAASNCAAMLTDATGVLIGATCAGRSHEEIMPVATRIGVNLSEEAVGTTAPGIVAKTGKQACVMGAEHYFDAVRPMQCAAAPIRNIFGQLAGVLDISSEHLAFDFDAAAVVGVYAASIENRLLISESREHLVLRMQVCASMLDTPMVGLAGIDMQGRLAWSNGTAARLIGLGTAPQEGALRAAEDVLGISLDRLASLPREGSAPLRLANGLTVWVRCAMQACDGRRGLVTVSQAPDRPCAVETPLAQSQATAQAKHQADPGIAEPAGTLAADQAPAPLPASLRDSDQEVIMRALRACNGNVSKAAKLLGVSRGLIYRRMKELAGG
jgi:transcriptional regulator of acetoin/glycerol metabolism